MRIPTMARGAAAFLLLAGLSACAGSPKQPSYPMPEDPGIYSLVGDDLDRLDGDPNWEATTWNERANLPSNVQFVVRDPVLATRAPGSSIELYRVAWVRSEINAANQAMPVGGNVWEVAPIAAYSVPFRYDSPSREPSVVRLVPSAPLSPGLYAIRINEPGARQARIGVNWNGIDQRQYSAANCVDRYVAEGVYRPCNAALVAQPLTVIPTDTLTTYNPGVTAPAAIPGSLATVPSTAVPTTLPATAVPAGLDIAMAEPIRRNNGLLIQGTVTNTTGQVQFVPAMQATLQDATGRDVQRWVFQPQVTSLAPGGRAAFQTEVRPVQPSASTVVVTFTQR